MRRDGITNCVRDPLTKSTLRKIPPSNQHLFSSEMFTAALEKAGGVKKAFLPPNKTSNLTTASQAGTSKPPSHPPQGSAHYRGPSQGTNLACCAQQHYYNQPSQGCYHDRPSQGPYYDRPSQGTSGHSHADRRMARGSFRSSRGNFNRNQDSNRGNRKRAGPSADYNSATKKRKY